jgi:hypothetical protein
LAGRAKASSIGARESIITNPEQSMTTGKEMARRLARGQGQADAHFGARSIVWNGARVAVHYEGFARPASAGWPEPFNHWFVGRSRG